MIKVHELKKSFTYGTASSPVLKSIDLTIENGEFVAIMGPSGSGKSTLLQLIGGLDTPTSGEIHVNETRLDTLNEKERTLFRRQNIGFIFQNYQLLSALSAEENVAFPLQADGIKKASAYKRVYDLLESVGLTNEMKRKPGQLSGGQQQRVAIARALINEPRLLLADEPTGNLDRVKAEEILLLISQLHKKQKQTIVMVTHDIYAAGFADRILLFKDGRIDHSIKREDDDYAEYMANFLA